MTGFHGFGDTADSDPRTRFECRICWYVYDPAAGDPVWQGPPGTPFTELPPHWSCPNCAALHSHFMVIHDD